LGDVINLLFNVEEVAEGENSKSFLFKAVFDFLLERFEACVKLFSRA
jgi:hypothetical protein